MITIRRSEERGQVENSWLHSQHTFSFGGYHDPKHMGFGNLRVINQDEVAAGGGFSPHGHRNMEIISYVTEGVLAHEDSIGGGGTIRHGEVQLMSAGSGIRHSEMNGSESERVRFLQIWILPNEENTTPGYAQHDFGRREFRRHTGEALQLLVSPDGRDGSLKIRQDVDVHRVLLAKDGSLEFALQRRSAWIQMVSGELEVDGELLKAGDAAAITDEKTLKLVAHADAEALLFDLE